MVFPQECAAERFVEQIVGVPVPENIELRAVRTGSLDRTRITIKLYTKTKNTGVSEQVVDVFLLQLHDVIVGVSISERICLIDVYLTSQIRDCLQVVSLKFQDHRTAPKITSRDQVAAHSLADC